MSDIHSEQSLIEKAKTGDEVSFELLINGCKTKAYNTALRYLKNEEDAMDVLQESLIKVFRNLVNFKGKSKFDTWVYRIVVNCCNDFLRKNKTQRASISIYNREEDGEGIMEISDESFAPEIMLERKLATSYLLECLERIPLEQKEIIVLRDIQGFSYEEISEILNCSMGTVKSRINRARQKLKQQYGNKTIKDASKSTDGGEEASDGVEYV